MLAGCLGQIGRYGANRAGAETAWRNAGALALRAANHSHRAVAGSLFAPVAKRSKSLSKKVPVPGAVVGI